MIRLSVITVVYNAVNDIGNTIASVANLRSNHIEHIVIDGGSTDGTLDIIKNNKKKLSVFISEEDAGIYDAMNKGVALSRGDWLIFLNAGDVFTKEFNLSLIDSIRSCNKEFIFFAYSIHGQGLLIEPRVSHKFGMPTSHQAMLISAKMIKLERFNPKLKVAADYELYLKRMKVNSKGVLFENIPIVEVMPGGYSHMNVNLMRREYQKIIFRLLGAKQAVLYFFWSRKFFYRAVKKTLPRFLFLKLKSKINEV